MAAGLARRGLSASHMARTGRGQAALLR